MSDWIKQQRRWQPHKDAGGTFGLAHLHPFAFNVMLPKSERHPARTVEIRVVFSCHTFTRQPKSGADLGVTPYLIERHGEVRLFCHQRYRLSQSLPNIVVGLPSRACYFTGRENYFVVESHPLLAAGQEYRVFFDLRHIGGSAHAILLYVQSAYAATRERGGPAGIRAKKVGFRVLINHALKNTRAKSAP